jgi:rare lipoprotein A
MPKGVIGIGIIASLLAVLAACTSVPSTPTPESPLLTSVTPPSSRAALAARGARKSAPAALPVEAEPVPEPAAVDEKYQLTGEAARQLERGQASWYGPRFHGRLTASGERYDMYALTAAHKTLPFGTVVRVRSKVLGREVDVRINDRGPFAPGRVIDVSRAAAEALGLLDVGVTEVSLRLLPDFTVLEVDPPQAVQKTRRNSRRSPAVKRR